MDAKNAKKVTGTNAKSANKVTGTNAKRVIVGADNYGFESKCRIVEHLREKGHLVEDIGTQGPARVLVEEYALGVARGVSEGRFDTGMLVCGTGQGMQLFANRISGARAALCNDIYTARCARMANDANVLCMGSDIIGTAHMLQIVDEWMVTGYAGGEDDQLEKLRKLDEG
jgi:ribose 5-phosphate isomerase B